MTSYEYFAAPEHTLSDLAAFACGDNTLVAFNIHRKKMTRILELTGWNDRLIREELFAFKKSQRGDHKLRSAASALTARFNRIIESLEKGLKV
ncbi:MAG: hypothetical protein MJ109_07000 [Kiritimatiellae bacterium]|nr:hypothetical protein [Kiritimatiellia bacterium]